MADNSHPPCSVTLSLAPADQWTLHHVLLHRIEEEATAVKASSVDPPSVEIFQAFEALDAGETSFTLVQLEAVQALLAEYHHSTTWWEVERARIEQLLHCVTDCIDQQARRSGD
jgi:hypothetical protein